LQQFQPRDHGATELQQLSNLLFFAGSSQPGTSADTQDGKLWLPFYFIDTNSVMPMPLDLGSALPCTAQTQGEEMLSLLSVSL